MALKATVGAIDANSYVTQAEANAYLSDRAYATAWEDFEDKDKVLITSSLTLDWYMKFKGVKTSTSQAMQWPRTGVLRKDGTEVAETIIPTDVKVAVYELTLSSLTEDRMSESDLAGIEQIRAGSLMIKADNGDRESTKKKVIPEKIRQILSDLVSLGGNVSVVRLMRG